MDVDLLMTDHPGWRPTGSGSFRLFLTDHGDAWLADKREAELSVVPLTGTGTAPQVAFHSCPQVAGASGGPLPERLAGLGQVARVANPSLWDAIATAIIRQVIRADQARRLYRNFCDSYGIHIASSDHSDMRAFPDPSRVIALSDDEFTRCGMAFKKRPLRHAAEAFLGQGDTWRQLSPSVLVKELQTIPGIGPWSAGAAVADWSNDFGFYPYGDLAVRTWARRVAPEHPWPDDEPSFARMWRQVTGDQLGIFTLLTLAWAGRVGAVV